MAEPWSYGIFRRTEELGARGEPKTAAQAVMGPRALREALLAIMTKICSSVHCVTEHSCTAGGRGRCACRGW